MFLPFPMFVFFAKNGAGIRYAFGFLMIACIVALIASWFVKGAEFNKVS
ncbi:MAG: hypothetical protein ACI4XL_12440 [Bacillus sp. (in: firmicutes)]